MTAPCWARNGVSTGALGVTDTYAQLEEPLL